MYERYSRQVLFQPIGERGQELLKQSTVTIIGCGALGTAISETLTRAGVGTLHIVDRDIVEHSNLQRQQLFTEADANECIPKVEAARKRLLEIRSDLNIYTYLEHAGPDLIQSLAKQSNLIMDATDNFETRFVINDVAFKVGIPWIYGGCVSSTSVVFPFIPDETPCYRCYVEQIPMSNATCDTVGIIAPAVQITAARQCAEALKWLTNNKGRMNKKLVFEDVWENEGQQIKLDKIKRQECKTCGEHPMYPSLIGTQDLSVLCGRQTLQINPSKERVFTLESIEQSINRLDINYKRTPFFIQFTYDGHRVMAFQNGRLLIHDTQDKQVGRKIYHQLFG